MKDQISSIRSLRYLIAALLLAGLLAAMFLADTERADASSARDGPSSATLSSPSLTSTGGPIPLYPGFDPGARPYTNQAGAESVLTGAKTTKDSVHTGSYTSGEETEAPDRESDRLHSNLRVPEWETTGSLQSVKAGDADTLEAYRGFNSRLTMQQELPQITLEADPAAYVAGVGALVFTVTRTGDAAAELDLTINVTQEQDWLDVTSFDVTIPAGESEQTLALFGDRFSSEVSESGNLTASVAPVDGYDTSDAAVVISVISQDGLAVVVRLDRVEYEVDEGAGTLGVVVVAVAHSSVSQVASFFISISTQEGDATPQNDDRDGDYRTLTDIEGFVSSDFQQENGSLTARNTVSVTIVEDRVYEGDERFHITLGATPGLSNDVVLLDPEGGACTAECPIPYVVTIRDNDEEPVLGLTVSPGRIVESGSTSAAITVGSTNGTSWPNDQAITFDFGGPATFGDDYTVSPADADSVTDGYQAVLEAGATEASLTVTAVDDSEEESCEWITVSAVLTEDSTPIHRERTIGVADDDNTSPGPSSSSICLEDILKLPGISVPKRQGNSVSMFWHTRERGKAEAPDGWKVERRHRNSFGWVVRTFEFIGADADALQTYSEEYWDWVDRTAARNVDYTYRVRAINADGSDADDRFWSRRAPVE